MSQVHIVQFDQGGKIEHIRVHWDQGSLLKQVDIIGSRAKNWPIRDGKDQARLIALSVSSSTTAIASDLLNPQSKKRISTSATRDPHASLALFAPPAEVERQPYEVTVAPRATAKPPPRDYQDIFAGNDSDQSFNAKAAVSSPSPTKKGAIGHDQKAGAGQHYQPNRLFESEPTALGSPEKSIKVNPKRYSHFELGPTGPSESAASVKPKTNKENSRPTSRHNNAVAAQWDFADFATPQKLSTKVRLEDVRHFDLDNGDADKGTKSPKWRPTVHQPRRDANKHFDFNDAPTPQAEKLPLGNITLAYNNQQHQKAFESQFELTDKSPSAEKGVGNCVNENKAKAVKTMDASWVLFDESPDVRKRSEKGIKTSGDGMGGKKGAGRLWGFGDDIDDEAPMGALVTRKGAPGAPKLVTASAESAFWDF